MNNSLLFSCSHFSAHSAYHKLRNYYDYGNIFQSPAIANLSTRPSVDPQSVLNEKQLPTQALCHSLDMMCHPQARQGGKFKMTIY